MKYTLFIRNMKIYESCFTSSYGIYGRCSVMSSVTLSHVLD